MYLSWSSAEAKARSGFRHALLLHGGQQLDLADLGVAGFGQIDALARPFESTFPAASSVRFATSICVRSAWALASLAAASFRWASAASRVRVTSWARGGATASSFSRLVKAGVFLLRQDQIGRGGLEPGLGLLDAYVDFVLRSASELPWPRLRPPGPPRGCGAAISI